MLLASRKGLSMRQKWPKQVTNQQKPTLASPQEDLKTGFMNTPQTLTTNQKRTRQPSVPTFGTWKDRGTTSWRIIDRGKAFNPSTKSCQVCLKEKYHIMFSSEGATLNSRREIFSTCRHRTKNLLCNSWKPVSFLLSTENFTAISVKPLFYVNWWVCHVIRNKFVLILC